MGSYTSYLKYNSNVSSEKTPSNQCPMSENTNNESSSNVNYPSECPMSKGDEVNQSAIDSNNLITTTNQSPTLDQPFPLSIDRIESSIPKFGGKEDEKWIYPSAQMFWNAMTRKGWKWKDDEVSEHDINNIIFLHNVNNELAWREVLLWESMHYDECKTPKLKRFGGKAKEFSPKARFRRVLGYDYPFDRHDWIVDRCGKEVRYVIDYYDGDVNSKFQFASLDVRPALDSFQAVFDRTRATFWRWTKAQPNLPFDEIQESTKSSSK